MRRAKFWLLLVASLFLAFDWGQGKVDGKAASKGGDQAGLQDRLKFIDLRWEILQKDNPPQVETAVFRVSVAEAKNLMARDKLEDAERKIQAAETWLDQNEEKYYLSHLQDLKGGKLKEDPSRLWQDAEKYWGLEAESFMDGDKRAAALYGKAGFGTGGLAVEAAISSDLPAADKADYCFKLEARHNRVLDASGALAWKNKAKDLLDRRIRLLQKQINCCLAGTVPMCELATIRLSEQDYQKARKVVEDSWTESQQLSKIRDQHFPEDPETLPDLGPGIQSWVRAQDDFYKKLSASKKPQTRKDFAQQKREEQARQKALADQYNRLYCKDSEESGKFGLRLSNSDMKIENGKLVVRLLMENLNSEPVYKPRLRLCGGVVSDEFNPGYPRFAGKYQASFSITSVAYLVQSSSEQEYTIMPFWALVIFEDGQGRQLNAKAIIKP